MTTEATHNRARIVLIMPSWVGDTVMATPFIRALKQTDLAADATIHAYARPGLDQVLDGLPELDGCMTGRPSGALGPWRESRRLRECNANTVILLPNSWRLGFTAWLSGIPRRIGYPREGRGWMLTDKAPCPTPGGWSTPISAVDYYLALLNTIDPAATEFDRTLQLASTDQQRAHAAEMLAQANVDSTQRLVLLNPGANRLDKRWPADRFAQLANDLHARTGVRALVNGSPAEASLVREIVDQCEPDVAINLCTLGVTLGSLKALCERVALVISNDTGTRHIAAGMGASSQLGLVSLFGPTDPAWARLDYPREREVVAHDQRMDSIDNDTVLDACLDLLEGT